MMSSEGFQYHFSIISKFICCDCYMKKNVAFTLISFAVLKWHECLSFQLPFELMVEIPVQLHLELEVNLLFHNVIEREIEREKVQMKPPWEKQQVGNTDFLTWLFYPPYGLVPMSTWKIPYRTFFFALKQGFQSGFFRYGQKLSNLTVFLCTWKNHYFEHFGGRQRLAGL